MINCLFILKYKVVTCEIIPDNFKQKYVRYNVGRFHSLLEVTFQPLNVTNHDYV